MRLSSTGAHQRGPLAFGRAMAVTLAAGLGACAVGPNYQAPAAPTLDVPAAWRAQRLSPPTPPAATDPAWWWVTFQDSPLLALIQAAAARNPSLEMVRARLREARAILAATESGYFPSLTPSASYTRSNNVGKIPLPGAVGAFEAKSGSADALFALDLFGRTRRSVEASLARLQAVEADLHGARVALVADLGNAYVARRHCEAFLAFTEADLASRAETHALTTARVQFGFSPPMDAMRTEASVAAARNSVWRLRATCDSAINALVALSGLSYAEVLSRLEGGEGRIPVVDANVDVPEIPAGLLERRSDLRAAERALAAASAEIGVAVADRLPSVSLSGYIGLARTSVGDLSRFGRVWSVTPTVSLPLFDGGLGAAREDAARARYDQALAQYHLQARNAVREVEDALVSVAAGRERLLLARRAEQQSRGFFEAGEASFRVGNTSLFELEDARQVLIGSSEAEANARLDLAQAWIALYRAVGGRPDPLGESRKVPAPPPPQAAVR